MKYSKQRDCRGSESQRQQHTDAYCYYIGQQKKSISLSKLGLSNILTGSATLLSFDRIFSTF